MSVSPVHVQDTAADMTMPAALASLAHTKVRMTSSRHAPYVLGDTRATMAETMGCYY
jgi:hypothetical protein